MKREQWRLPKTFEPAKVIEAYQQFCDGEPDALSLIKYTNDNTLSTHEYIKCCDCGLAHLRIYNVIKTPDGRWYIKVRSYRVPSK